MGLLDSLEGMAGHQEPDGGTQSKVATGLMQSLDEHPGGLAGVLDSFKRNGMEDHVQGWATGQQPSATPEQVQQGLGGTGLVERVAEKAGVSPQVAQVAMATVLPWSSLISRKEERLRLPRVDLAAWPHKSWAHRSWVS